MKSAQEQYNELAYYTLSHPDPAFIHQLVVDAFAAQQADKKTKPITIAFALAGLYLHNEKKYTGKAVQQAHMILAKKKKIWPTFELPKFRWTMTIEDILRAAPGTSRDKAINNWSAAAWTAWSESHTKVAEWLKTELGI